MKQIALVPVFYGLSLLSGQVTQPAPRPASLDDVVLEIRALRTEVQHMADASVRAQLLVARLQVEEQRIGSLSRDLADTDAKIAALQGARNPMLTKMLKNFEQQPANPDEPDMMAFVKAQLEKIENGDPALKERQASLSRLLADEQARWMAFNAQLEQLEKSAAAKR
jgi:chromosome segregation ATPase